MHTIAQKAALILLSIAITACHHTNEPQTYSGFLQEHRKDYPETMETFFDRQQVEKATPQSPIHICLEQQRGRLYVDGKVAADWPVSTGKDGSETPTGTFPIMEKKKRYFSITWGTIVDKDDICVVESADSRVDKVPPGGAFLGAKMMNWQRLTGGGIGIHTGPVRGGQRVSHGCIRTPGFIADALFEITKVGSKVTITQKPETAWPGNQPTTDIPQTPPAKTDEATIAETQSAES